MMERSISVGDIVGGEGRVPHETARSLVLSVATRCFLPLCLLR